MKIHPGPCNLSGRGCVSGVCVRSSGGVCKGSGVVIFAPHHHLQPPASEFREFLTDGRGDIFIMKVQLLLLLALVGPFCAFTHASPTALPEDLDTGVTEMPPEVPEVTEAPKEELTVLTGAPDTDPPAAPEEVVTEAATEAAPPAPVETEASIVETEGPPAVTEGLPEPLVTEAPAVVTAAPTEAAPEEEEKQPVATAAAELEPDVVIEEEATHDGLSSGQVVGIVIGALLAVVIVIAVVIAAVRRMGKYSP